MRLSRNLGSDDLIVLLRRYGYEATRQTGSYSPDDTPERCTPYHDSAPQTTSDRNLAGYPQDIAGHLKIEWPTFLDSLFGS
jgi:hypothetical protein